MVSGQRIDTATVQKAGNDLDEFAGNVATRLSMIRNQAEQLSRTYAGQGATAFQQSMLNWDSTANNIQRAIREMAQNVRSAASQHTQGDAATVDAFRSASSGASYSGALGG